MKLYYISTSDILIYNYCCDFDKLLITYIGLTRNGTYEFEYNYIIITESDEHMTAISLAHDITILPKLELWSWLQKEKDAALYDSDVFTGYVDTDTLYRYYCKKNTKHCKNVVKYTKLIRQLLKA